jgi:hypothetical protein
MPCFAGKRELIKLFPPLAKAIIDWGSEVFIREIRGIRGKILAKMNGSDP